MDHKRKIAGDIEVGRALPIEYPVILNGMPPEWLISEDAYQMYLQVADMINANRFLVAQVGQRLAGGVGWQDNIAYGALYAKFIFVNPEFQDAGVAARLYAEVITIARELNKRAVFCDVPENSPFGEFAKEMPGLKEVGYIDGFHETGVRSRIFAFDFKQYDMVEREVERRLKHERGIEL